jgi:predicted phosphodiesterase
MRAAVVSDLHLGTTKLPDVARRPEVRARLVEAVAGAETVVLLGDVLELRQQPLSDALAAARPFFEDLGRATEGKRVVLVPGNHDHQLAEPYLAGARLDGRELPLESVWEVEPSEVLLEGRIAGWMPRTELAIAYPGVHLRKDVYAIHGHYVDVHLTVPRIESLAAAASGRISGRGRECHSVLDYEAVLGPIYSLLYSLAQSTPPATLQKGGGLSRRVWRRVNDEDGRVGAFLLGRVTIPAAVAALNRAGFGPFSPELTGPELRRAGLRAMGEVVDSLGIEADHVLFGHTHRAGPGPDDDESAWRSPGGVRLWNTGSWLVDPAFVATRDGANPYWPGTVATVPDEGEPGLANVLEDVELREMVRA